mgnify:CR=1 FL=1
MALIVLLFYPSLRLDIDHLFKPRVVEDIKPVLKFISSNRQDGDFLYVYYGAEPGFRYYSQIYGLDKIEHAISINSREKP